MEAQEDKKNNDARGSWSGILAPDRLALVLVPALVFVGCGLAGFGESAGEVLSTLGSDAVATMPDPPTGVGGSGISATQFWATWGATLAMHEGRKLIRLFMKNKF